MKRLCIQKSYWQQDISRKEYLLAIVRGIIILMGITYLFYQSFIMAVVLSPLFIFYYRSWKTQCIKKKKEVFQTQFKDAMQAMSAALSVGYAMENAIKESLKDLRMLYGNETRIIQEFSLIVHQLNMNMTAEQALKEFAERVSQEDVENFVTVFVTAKRSGGDMVQIIRNAVSQICDKLEVKREIQTLMSAKRLEFQVMTLIPFGIIAYMKVSFPEFMHVLYGNIVGVMVMSVCLLIYCGAYRLGQHIVEIEV